MRRECLCSDRVSVVQTDTAEQIMFVAQVVLGSAGQLHTFFSLHRYTHMHTHFHKHTRIHVYCIHYIQSVYEVRVYQCCNCILPTLNRLYGEIVPVLQRCLKYRCQGGGTGKAGPLSRIDAPPNLTI